MKRLLPLLLLALPGCGEPLATGEYLGEPLLALEGNIYLAEAEELVPTNLSVALFWTDDLTAQWLDEPSAEVLEQNAVTSSTFPARYSLTLFEPPAEAVFRSVPDGEGSLATAVILVYSDLNGDGALSLSDEPVVGGSLEYVVAFTPEGATSELLGGDVPKGYSVMRILPPEAACEADAPLAALRVAGERSDIDLIVGPDVRDQLPDVDCDGQVNPWLDQDCGPIVATALNTQNPAQWRDLQRAYTVCLTLGKDECEDLGREVMAQPFALRDERLGMSYLECAGLVEPDPCARQQFTLENAEPADRPAALTALAACAERHMMCERLAPFGRPVDVDVAAAHRDFEACLSPNAQRGSPCLDALLAARESWSEAGRAHETVQGCVMRGLDCRVQGEAWRTSLAAALGRYGRVTACIPTSAQCEELLAARDRAQAESERQLEALQECQEQERDDCRTLSSSLRSAQERERTTQEAYDDCLRQAPTDAVCQPQLRKLEDTTSARAFVTGLQVECLVQ